MNSGNETLIATLRACLWLHLVLIVLLALPTSVGMVLFLPLLYLLYGGIQASMTLRGLRWLKRGKECPWPFRKPVDVYAAVTLQALYSAGLILAILYIYGEVSFTLHDVYENVRFAYFSDLMTSPEFFWLGCALPANLFYLALLALWVLGRLVCSMKP